MMAKQLEFNEKEQEQLAEALKIISCILVSKMDDGVYQPQLEGKMDFNGEDRFVEFSIIAKKKPLGNRRDG